MELAIFAAISSLSLYSIYHLFHDGQGFQTAVLSPPGRAPAAETTASASFDLTCSDTPMEQLTHASKVRLSGPICGVSATEPLVEPRVRNQTNEIQATVFLDQTSRRFLTDFVPLNPGKNVIAVSFELPGRKRHLAAEKKNIVVEITRNY